MGGCRFPRKDGFSLVGIRCLLENSVRLEKEA